MQIINVASLELTIGTLLTHTDSRWSGHAQGCLQNIRIYDDYLRDNDYLVNGEYVNLTFVRADVHHDSELLKEVTEELIQGNHNSLWDGQQEQPADMIFCPYSSGFTTIVSEITQGYNIPTIASCAAADTLYLNNDGSRRFNQLVSPGGLASEYLSVFVQLLNVLGVRTITIITEEGESFAEAMAQGIRNQVARYSGMSVTYDFTVTPDYSLSDVAAHLSLNDVSDAVFGAVYDDVCEILLNTFQSYDINYNAIIFSTCVGNTDFQEAMGSKHHFVMGPTFWNKDLTSHIYDETTHSAIKMFPSVTVTEEIQVENLNWNENSNFNQWSTKTLQRTKLAPELFYDAYMSSLGRTPTYQDAQCMSSVYLLHNAIDKATLYNIDISEGLEDILETSLVGLLGINPDGYNDIVKPLGAQYDDNGYVSLVYPSSVANASVIFPIPPWNQRHCWPDSCEECEICDQLFDLTKNVLYGSIAFIFTFVMFSYWYLNSQAPEDHEPIKANLIKEIVPVILAFGVLMYTQFTNIISLLNYIYLPGESTNVNQVLAYGIAVGGSVLVGMMNAFLSSKKIVFILIEYRYEYADHKDKWDFEERRHSRTMMGASLALVSLVSQLPTFVINLVFIFLSDNVPIKNVRSAVVAVVLTAIEIGKIIVGYSMQQLQKEYKGFVHYCATSTGRISLAPQDINRYAERGSFGRELGQSKKNKHDEEEIKPFGISSEL